MKVSAILFITGVIIIMQSIPLSVNAYAGSVLGVILSSISISSVGSYLILKSIKLNNKESDE